MTYKEEKRYWGRTEVIGEQKGLKITVMNYYPPLCASAQIDKKAVIFDRRFYEALTKTGRMCLYNEVLEHERREWEISAKLHKKQGIELNEFSNIPLKEDIVAKAHRMAREFHRKGFERELKGLLPKNYQQVLPRE